MDDLISRAAACACIGKMIKEYREKGEDDLADGMILARRYGIKRLPNIDAVPVVHAHWKHFAMSDDCSNCGYSTGKYESPSRYCPDCGAKMDGRG